MTAIYHSEFDPRILRFAYIVRSSSTPTVVFTGHCARYHEVEGTVLQVGEEVIIAGVTYKFESGEVDCLVRRAETSTVVTIELRVPNAMYQVGPVRGKRVFPLNAAQLRKLIWIIESGASDKVALAQPVSAADQDSPSADALLEQEIRRKRNACLTAHGINPRLVAIVRPGDDDYVYRGMETQEDPEKGSRYVVSNAQAVPASRKPRDAGRIVINSYHCLATFWVDPHGNLSWESVKLVPFCTPEELDALLTRITNQFSAKQLQEV